MSAIEESGMGRIYIKVGSDIIDLTGSATEVSDGLLIFLQLEMPAT